MFFVRHQTRCPVRLPNRALGPHAVIQWVRVWCTGLQAAVGTARRDHTAGPARRDGISNACS
jgi:hypothetical protein